MTDQELALYYQNLLIIQYNILPRATAMVNDFVLQAIASQIIQKVIDGFDVLTAVGAQLDILGDYVGHSRQIVGLTVSKTFFQFRDAAAPPPPTEIDNGFADVSNPVTMWYWLQPSDLAAITYIMNDGEYRQVIQYLAAVESLDFSMESIDQLFQRFFGIYVTFVDNGNMTMTITHNQTSDPNFIFKYVNAIGALPRPSGVALTVITT